MSSAAVAVSHTFSLSFSLSFLYLPVCSVCWRQVSACFVESVSFVDVLHATGKINVLTQAESGITPEGHFDTEAQRRFISGSAAATQAVQAFLAAQGVFHADDLLELAARDLPKLLRDAAAWTPHRLLSQRTIGANIAFYLAIWRAKKKDSPLTPHIQLNIDRAPILAVAHVNSGYS